MEKKDAFQYTYSAKEQEEIKNIRKKYAPSEEPVDKLTQLRHLDKRVSDKATVKSLVLGIVGMLLLGIGMSLAMSEFSEILGLHKNMAYLIGIPSGMAGIAMICLAYPAYNRVLKKEREKIAPEIIRLTDELMK